MNIRALVITCAIAALLGLFCGYVVSVIELNKLRSEKIEIGGRNGRE